MKLYKKLKIAIIILSVLVIWFTAVDKYWFAWRCLDCGYRNDTLVYRLFRIPLHVSQIDENHTELGLVGIDLGVPCSHENNSGKMGMVSMKGLVFHYAIHPSPNSVYWLGGNWYTDEAKLRLKEIVLANPHLAQEFQKRIWLEHDMNYWHELSKKLKGRDLETKRIRSIEVPEQTQLKRDEGGFK